MADIHGFMKYDCKENQKISPIKESLILVNLHFI